MTADGAGTGRSLHIGINSVDPARYAGWDGQLVACEADALAMADIARSAGFAADVLLTDQATRDAVCTRLQAAAAHCGPGDIFLLTYAGHGGQIEDWSGDEPDQVDETWCLFDRQLIDDEIFTFLKGFAAGVRIVIVSDSCHSGSVYRTAMVPRRKEDPSPRRVRAMPATVCDRTYENDKAFYNSIETRLFAQDWKSVSDERDYPLGAAVFHMSGCKDNQYSNDGDTHGYFTEQLLAVWDGGAFKGTYADLHDAILSRIELDQTPQLVRFGAADPAFDSQRAFTV
jgi:hypothetical protein